MTSASYTPDLRISVIIPCWPPDINELPNMLGSFTVSTYLPDEVIISLSESSTEEGAALEKQFQNNYAFSTNVSTTQEKQFAGQNRNRGAEIAKYDILVFCDADDICHPQKLEITKKIFEEYRPAMFLHSFLRKDNNFETYATETLPLIFTETLFYYTFGNPPRRDNSRWIFTDRPATAVPAEGFHPHHGYPAVHKSVFKKIRYPAIKVAEDSEFCLDVLWTFRNAIFANVGLVNYIKDL